MRCAYCGSDVDINDDAHTARRYKLRDLYFCNDDCEADYFTPSDEPIDYDEADRNAHQSELYEMWRNEY